jgi:50S ribosomal protein L16 3-hydroxylase
MAPTAFEEERFDADVFFAQYWRKKPLFVKASVREFLGRTWTHADFATALAKARAVGGDMVKERPGEVSFIEKVSAFDTDLAERAAGFSRIFGAPEAWFDSVRTYSADGIGAHFDHSDNFVLQQSGTKQWSLASPEHIDRADIARRMMNMPGVGAHPMPEHDVIDFVVEPGDLLYIPLNWLHCGVSRAESLSLSLVCPAVSLYSAVLPFVVQALKNRALGHQPIPAFHVGLSSAERAVAEEALTRATRTLLQSIAGDDVAGTVHALQAERLLAPAWTADHPTRGEERL